MYRIPSDLDLKWLVGARCTTVGCCLYMLQLSYEFPSSDEELSICIEFDAIIQLAGELEGTLTERPWTSGAVVRQLGRCIVSARAASGESIELVYDNGDRFVWINGPNESIAIRIGNREYIL